MRHVEFRHIFMCGYVLKLVYAGLRLAGAKTFFFSIGAALYKDMPTVLQHRCHTFPIHEASMEQRKDKYTQVAVAARYNLRNHLSLT